MGTQATYQIGQTIYALLKERGLTQQSLADGLGISKQVMNKIINGKKVMNVAELARIAQVLGISTDVLLAGLVSPPASNLPVFAFRGIATSDEDKETLEVLRIIDLYEDAIMDNRLPEAVPPDERKGNWVQKFQSDHVETVFVNAQSFRYQEDGGTS